jgi:hypothetical protein
VTPVAPIEDWLMTGCRGLYDEDDDDTVPYVAGLDDDDVLEDWDNPYPSSDDDAEESSPRPAWRRSPWPLAGTLLTLLLVVALVVGRNADVFGGRDRQLTVPVVPPSGLVYCDGVDDTDRARIEWAVTEMQRIDEGKALFERLVDMDLCIDTEDIPYNAGYTEVRSNGREWMVDRIVFATTVVLPLNPDELAALLVHEATHADRVARGESCDQTGNCTILANGVPVEEEVAAHAAEASFWIALHGPNGTRTGASWTGGWGAAWENQLAAAAQKGPDALREFVIEARSGSREGEGITP